MDDYISSKEAAEILGYSTGYITRLCREGKFDLVAAKSGPKKSWLIPRVAVEQFKEKKGAKKK